MKTPDIKRLRKKLNLTQEQLAQRIHVSFVTVSRWENGHFKPSWHLQQELNRLAKTCKSSQ